MNESLDNIHDINEKNKEPSTTSDDPNERKLARRLRIQRRLEESSRLAAVNVGTYVEPEVQKPPLDQAIEDSEDVLENLFIDGKELVSNIRVASDAREVERRENELSDSNARLQILEEEAALALEKLNDITNRWEVIQDINDPLNLHQHMKEQKAKCLELIQQKNDLIKNFQMELKVADENYMKNRRKMYEDLSLLTQRIDEQVLVMKKAYRLELKNIEDVVDSTRTTLMEDHQKSWQALYNARERNETINMNRKFKLVENHEMELDELHRDHEEKYRDTRIRLETDIQTLEQELERVKALCLLNSEKLDYNYQVLKKREEENVYIKNHQKRKLNKLQDILSNLKKKIDEKQSSTDTELKRINQDLKRYHDNVMEIEKKAEHFSIMNEDTYQSIWDMKSEEANDIVNRIVTVDKIIHEQILGTLWEEPKLNLIHKTELPSFKSAKKVISKLFSQSDEIKHEIDLGEDEVADARRAEFEKGHQRLLKQILQMIADQSGFLVEEKLDDLLKPYTSEEKTLVRLDNVFTAIGISTAKDVQLMKNSFLPYATCPLCDKRKQSEPSIMPDASSDGTQEESQVTGSQTVELEEKLSKIIMETSVVSLNASVKTEESARKDSLDLVQFLHKDDAGGKSNVLQCNITHPLMIEKIYVLNALKDFVTEFHADNCRVPTGMAARLAKQRNTVSRMLAKEDVEKYWERYKLVVSQEQERQWSILFRGMSRYYEMLQDRHKLNVKAQKLKQQNTELRRLLARYVTSNAEDTKFFLPHMSKEEKNIIDLQHLQEIIRKVQI